MEPKHQTLLVVDDEAEIREIIQLNALPLGVDVIEAGDGQEALELLHQHKVDVIVSDLMMPRMSGITFLGEMRNAGFSQPFIFLTAYPSQDSTLQALRLGAFDYIEKPFEGDELRTLLAEALRVSAETQRLDVQAAGEIKKLRTLRYNNAAPKDNAGGPVPAAQQKLHDLFISEATPQLLFCEASIKGLLQPDERSFELGYLFRVMQGIASAADSIGAAAVVEMARAAESFYMLLRVRPRAVNDLKIQLAADANRMLQLLVTTLGRDQIPEAASVLDQLRDAARELEVGEPAQAAG